jgi:acetoacetyl-CoA reductase/3-oxoacyl-[acyl-carrier protein] reductase
MTAGVTISLEGSNVLLTGGSGGIGSAVARILVAAGARVANLDLPGTRAPEGVTCLPCDLEDRAALRAAASEAGDRFDGVLHAVIHCAGITRDAILWKMSDEDWTRVLRVNLDSAFLILRETVPMLRRAGAGSVVFVSSINGERGKIGQANYAASKAGLLALARTAARELGRFQIRVNAVAPGFVTTPMTGALPEEIRRKAVDETTLGRAGDPEDVAGAILFLCSNLSRHVTGQVIRVDGGQMIG